MAKVEIPRSCLEGAYHSKKKVKTEGLCDDEFIEDENMVTLRAIDAVFKITQRQHLTDKMGEEIRLAAMRKKDDKCFAAERTSQLMFLHL
mmetsp:Transcript_15323/g.19168  ORF Transcript_15323/g.19168 Transcript_15323/m.19168 type:complete len:90 (-) Transcript_15323:638-907(-)